MPEMPDLNAFFKTENLFLVVGATENKEKYGSKVFRDLRDAGYHIVAINNHVAGHKSKDGPAEIYGTPAYASVESFLARVVELFDEARKQATLEKIIVVLVIPPTAGEEVVKESLAHGINKFWFQPGAESDAAIKACEAAGAEYIHDQCIMVQRPH